MSWGGRASCFRTVDQQLAGAGTISSPEVLQKALIAGGKPIADAARPLVRVNTGRLRDSIVVGTALSPHQATLDQSNAIAEVFVGPGPLPEAITEEFGTPHETPHPFMRPAWEAQQGAAIDAIAAELGTEFDERAGG